ncbi:MAG: histidine phosphatase family protein [Gammaproteobacteria bacterium]|nr:MAG: histidine phosphatase family protein [Gammaproteobacteria bacterium]
MQVYFMRHGQTNYNVQSLCNDDPTRDVHLTHLGIEQAEIVASKLKDKKIQRIIVSQLPRTRQTAEIINQYHHAPIEPRAEINDIRSGFDSQPVINYQNAIAHDPIHAKHNNGESLFEHRQRVLTFLDWLRLQPEEIVLVVAHEETMRVFYGYFHKMILEDIIKLSFDNCSYLEFNL